METSLPTPMTARVYVNLPEGIFYIDSMTFSLLLGNQMAGFPELNASF